MCVGGVEICRDVHSNKSGLKKSLEMKKKSLEMSISSQKKIQIKYINKTRILQSFYIEIRLPLIDKSLQHMLRFT